MSVMPKKYTFAQCAIALSMLLLAATAQAAQVRAWLDRNSMQMGETVTLNVEASDITTAATPDFSALQKDFTLGGTQSSSNVEIVNGRTSAKLLWAVALEPKHEGVVTIPELSVAGQSTQPLTLTVAPMAPGGTRAGDDVYIESSVDPLKPYVQQQVTMTVKLFFAVNLVDGTLDDPQAEGAIVKRIGAQDTNFAAEVGGRRYRVLERRYVLQPERSGSITIAPLMFRGHAMDRNDMNSFFTRGRNVTAHTDATVLDVRPRPVNSGNDAWLPAQSVTLSAEGLNPNANPRVGDPLTLTLRLKATGLGFEQLPELNLPKIDGADIYPDKATTQNRDTGDVISGERERKFAIVPNRAGPLTIPSIGIDWWDVVHDRPETASVPEVSLNVEAAPGTPVAPSTAAPVVSSQPPQPAVLTTPVVAADSSEDVRTWRALALAAIALWLITVVVALAMWRRLAQRSSAAPPEFRTLPENGSFKNRFRQACLESDWTSAANALIAWITARGIGARNLGDVARALDDAEQTQAVDELQRVLYGGATASDIGAKLLAVFKNGPHVSSPIPRRDRAALPPLYPVRAGKRV